MTRFSNLIHMPDGTLVESNVRHIEQSDMMKCPHCIMVADHYRDDGTCKCNDPKEVIMKEWGYKWKKGQWR